MFVFYLWFLLFLRWSCYVVQATSSLWPSCFNLPSSAGITCIHYCSQLQFFFFLFFFFFFLWYWGLNSGPTPHFEPFYQPFFVMGFFKIGSRELFAWAGFEPWSFWSLPPERYPAQIFLSLRFPKILYSKNYIVFASKFLYVKGWLNQSINAMTLHKYY
jgi:hypothetical protein